MSTENTCHPPPVTCHLPDPDQLIISNSPHISARGSIVKIMFQVLAALIPALIASVWFFGFNALRVIVLCTAGCIATEIIWTRLAKRDIRSWKDGSAAVTGVLLAMNLSAGAPWWICVLGSLLAIGLGKQLFGGLGFNPFNPALVARVALLIGFPSLMTTWVAPNAGNFFVCDALTGATPLAAETPALASMSDLFVCDVLTGATPLAVETSALASMSDLFFGNVGGCLGETSALALIIGAGILFAFKLIRWQVPLAFIGTVAIITGAVHHVNPELTPPALYHVLSGGLLLGAFFMATDMVTSPITSRGALIFGFGCGIITSVIRIWGGYPEGVSFAILFMNALTPLIDRFTIGKPFGYTSPRKAAEAAKK